MDTVYGFPYHTCPAPAYLRDGHALGRLARAAEEAGFDGVHLTDHPAPSQAWREAGGHDSVDQFVGLAFAAAATTTIRLFTYLTVLPYRNPFHLANTVGSLDALSGGRLELGLGAGYLKSEARALGVDWEERNALFDEAVEVLQATFTGEPVTYEGRHFSARGTVIAPGTVQPGGPPLWIGGNSALSRRRIVGLGAGWLPLPTSRAHASNLRSVPMENPEDFAALMRRMADDAAERGVPAPDRALYPMAAVEGPDGWEDHLRLAHEVRDAGASGLAVNAPASETLAEAENWIAEYGKNVLQRL